MNRRTFSKLISGALGAFTVIESPPAGAASASGSEEPQDGGGSSWHYCVVDAAPPMTELSGTAVGDIDGDGHMEVVIAGRGSLAWYRLSTWERGTIASGDFNVGIAIGEVDGRVHILAGKAQRQTPGGEEAWQICGYHRAGDRWSETVLDGDCDGAPHDLVLADVDADGRLELAANSMYSDKPGFFLYRLAGNGRWEKHAVQQGISAEGTVLADVDGDGILEIICGPYLFRAPSAGPFSGTLWEQYPLAPGMREMCRAVALDVTGDGRPDLVIVESEYPDGRLAWFENRCRRGRLEFLQHEVDAPFNFAHTLQVWPAKEQGSAGILLAEMNEGGWDAPYNWQARLLRLSTRDRGATWTSRLLYRGEGSHQAVVADVNGDGRPEIVGHSAQIRNEGGFIGWVQMFHEAPRSTLQTFRHRFLDREKPVTGTDMTIADVDGDGSPDILCASWWYRAPTWERYEIPGVYQVLTAYDIDRDGRPELIAIRRKEGQSGWYNQLNSDLFWLKAIDPLRGRWAEHHIGTGDGDWPHGSIVAPVLPGGKLALVCGYHEPVHPPQIFEVPPDPTAPWPKRLLADIRYGEQIVTSDLTGSGRLDLICGPYWVSNNGDGTFTPHLLAEGFAHASRVAVADINGDGRPDVVLTTEDLDFQIGRSNFAPVAWLENTGDPSRKSFRVHIIDRIRSPHSLSVADIDGDGEPEVIAGEHDPFHPYRTQCRLYVYKKANKAGTSWLRYVIDDRFEHHDGAKLLPLRGGEYAIASHGWVDSRYVHLWTRS